MIPIVIPTNNRPDYLIKVLVALFKCENLDKFKVMTFEEPNSDVSSLLDNFGLLDIERHPNPSHLGCTKNIHHALTSGFNQFDKVIVLEDDIIPAPDFLNYFLWAFDTYEYSNDILGICSYQMHKEKPASDLINRTDVSRMFNPWGWGTWVNRFNRIDNSGIFRREEKSWDCLLAEHFYFGKYNLFIKPVVGRTQNIGEHGTYVPSPEWQRANQHTPFWAGDGSFPVINENSFV